jgi:hypothetical protein
MVDHDRFAFVEIRTLRGVVADPRTQGIVCLDAAPGKIAAGKPRIHSWRSRIEFRDRPADRPIAGWPRARRGLPPGTEDDGVMDHVHA